jgi:hypothetical protein
MLRITADIHDEDSYNEFLMVVERSQDDGDFGVVCLW